MFWATLDAAFTFALDLLRVSNSCSGAKEPPTRVLSFWNPAVSVTLQRSLIETCGS